MGGTASRVYGGRPVLDGVEPSIVRARVWGVARLGQVALRVRSGCPATTAPTASAGGGGDAVRIARTMCSAHAFLCLENRYL